MTKTVPIRDCPAIVEAFDNDTIFATIQNFLFGRRAWKANLTDLELFMLAWSHYDSSPASDDINKFGDMVKARAEGDYSRWISSRVLPCYMGSWFNAATEGQ